MKPRSTKLDYSALNRLFAAHQRAYYNYLHIDIDKCSKSDTKKILEDYERRIVELFSQPDTGIKKKKIDQKKSIVVKDGSEKRLYVLKDNAKNPAKYIKYGKEDLCNPWQNLEEQEIKSEEESSLSSSPDSSTCNEDDNETDRKEESSTLQDSGEKQQGEESAEPVLHDYYKLSFLRNVGLIPREEYEMLKKGADPNKKQTRSKRTTANPQFSSAAIEAKLVTRHEISKERKQRQLAKKMNQLTNKKLLVNSIDTSEKREIARKKLQQILQDCIDDCNKLYEDSTLIWIGKTANFKDYCRLCGEETFPESNDTILACNGCGSFYHANCLVNKRNLIAGKINCPICTSENTSDLDDDKSKRIHRLVLRKKHIQGLSISNQLVQSIIKDTQSEIDKISDETKSLEIKVDKIKNIFKHYGIKEEANQALNNLFPEHPKHSSEDGEESELFKERNGSSSNVMDYEYHDQNESIVQNGFAQVANCDKDFPVFCA